MADTTTLDPASNAAAKVTPADAKPKAGMFGFDNIRSLAVLVIAIFALRWSVASPYHVPTASMEPTIKVGDRLLAFKLAYELKIPWTDISLKTWGTPKRGDIIVFKYPRDPDIDYVKRVVAVAGDQVKIEDDILYVNNEAQPRVPAENERAILDDIEDTKEDKLLFKENLFGLEHYTMQNIPSARHFTSSRWPTEKPYYYTVPENSVFCVGDNRDNSTDSRFWGQVPLEYVRGKALFVIWSIHSPRDSQWPELRLARFGKWLY